MTNDMRNKLFENLYVLNTEAFAQFNTMLTLPADGLTLAEASLVARLIERRIAESNSLGYELHQVETKGE